MSDRTTIFPARIFDGRNWHEGKALSLQAGKLAAITQADALDNEANRIDAAGLIAVPGFVDLQVNGGGGVLFNNRPDEEGIARICAAHARFGTTALLATLISDRPDITAAAMAAGSSAWAAGTPGFLGLHFEGPHIAPSRKGTHDPAAIRPMGEADMEALIACKKALPHIMITIAPESVTEQQVRTLSQAGIVVSLGHSDASFATARAYAKAGASMVTHIFNAMSPLGHREPGLVGAALCEGSLACGLIADGFHVDAAAMAIALKAKTGPGRIFLVTDAMATIGTDDDSFEINGRRVYRDGGRLTLADGTLAGADIDMLSCLRFVHEQLGLPLEEVLRMASLYPAEAMGLPAKGRLETGCDADFVLLSADLSLHSTWIGGKAVFTAPTQEKAP